MTAPRGFPELPAKPLADAIDRALARMIITREDYVTQRWIGISDRTLREWRYEKRKNAKFNVADRVLCGLNLNWFEVWNEGTVPDPITLAKVTFAFTGEGAGEQLELAA